MAERPVFVPLVVGPRLVEEVQVSFTWHSGMAPSQKRKNIIALHLAASHQNLSPLLEISSKPENELGRGLSAFALLFSVEGQTASVESVYQGSKVFEQGGPYADLYQASSREARGDLRLRESGRLIGFRFEDKDYPLTPTTAFYDWLYLNAIYRRPDLGAAIQTYVGFTDIEFNPQRSANCQARSCATLVTLTKRGALDDAVESFEYFRDLLAGGAV